MFLEHNNEMITLRDILETMVSRVIEITHQIIGLKQIVIKTFVTLIEFRF